MTDRAERRRNQTTFNLVLALIASFLVGGVFIFSWVTRPIESQVPDVDYRAAAAESQSEFGVPLAAPDLPEGWSANRAELGPVGSDGIRTWQIGFLTPSGQYIGLVQGVDANDTWVAQQTENHAASGVYAVADVDWDIYDRRTVNDPGNVAYALVGTIDTSTIVLGGTATDEEFQTLATAITEELGA